MVENKPSVGSKPGLAEMVGEVDCVSLLTRMRGTLGERLQSGKFLSTHEQVGNAVAPSNRNDNHRFGVGNTPLQNFPDILIARFCQTR